MNLEYTAVIKQDGDWWVGWIQEVPGVNCQEKSYEALRETLTVTLEEASSTARMPWQQPVEATRKSR